MKQVCVNAGWRRMWPLAGLLLTACASTSNDSMPVQPPQIPALPPTLAKPPLPESFLERAQQNIEQWQKALMDSATK